MIKKLLSLLGMTALLLSTAYAKSNVIELDNHNMLHCQEQLKNDDWVRNVLMLYVKDSPGTEKFRANYDQVSTEYPQRHLFALRVFDPKADAKENQLIWKTVKGCLTNMWYRREDSMGEINTKTPALLLNDYAAAIVGVDDLSTKEDIIKFIQDKKESS